MFPPVTATFGRPVAGSFCGDGQRRGKGHDSCRWPFDYRDASLLDQFKVELVTLETELGVSSR